MATFLIRRDKAREEDRNASGVAAVLVSAASEAAARAAAQAAAPGGTRIPDSWVATQLAATELPAGLNPTYFEGDAVSDGRFRGT